MRKKQVYSIRKINKKRYIFKGKDFVFMPETCTFVWVPSVKSRGNLLITEHMFKKYEKAARLAMLAHKGQIDKSGKEYYLHPCRVSQKVRCKGMDANDILNCMIVGLLHDTVEDTEVRLKDLIDLGFDYKIIGAVELLTRRKDEDYFSYIRILMKNRYAKEVKRADLLDNMDVSRLPSWTAKDKERMAKYAKAFKIIEDSFDLYQKDYY